MTKVLTIPLSLKDIQENYNQKVIIDYTESKLKTKDFFTYLKNLNMDYEIVGLEKLDFDQKKELLSYFIHSSKIIKQFPIVLDSYYALLFHEAKLENEEFGFLTKEDIEKLTNEYKEDLLLKDAFLFLTFCYPLGLSFLVNEKFSEEEVLAPLKQAPQIKQPLNITCGIISLLYAPQWGILVSNDYPVYDLTDYVTMYQDMHLFGHIMNENNDLLSFVKFAQDKILEAAGA